jgi:hypothetical protein
MGLKGARTVVLLGHGADVAPELGAVLAGDRRRSAAAAFPHLPDDSAFQMELLHIIAGMMGAGVFERYP